MNEANIIEKDKQENTPQNIAYPLKSVKKNEIVLFHATEKADKDIENGVM